MVGGLDIFRERFSQFSDNFVIIGGTACDEILSGTGMRPRATMDIDIVVIVENMTSEFARAFWAFIAEGGYRLGVRKDKDEAPKYVLYSFDHGKVGFPVKVELLSRHNEIFRSAAHTEPLPIDGEVSSLSTIILDEPYYNLTVQNSFVSASLRYAAPLALMALKARAYLNLIADREAGKKINTKDILKHRNDVLKLTATLTGTDRAIVDAEIADTIRAFAEGLLQSLPNQSLQDALRSSEAAIRMFLEALPTYYTARQ
ncbi:MAG: nucleotidyl transferase AbiEii/AbiGii toxin family protein [Muribaculaceae bacterium]